MCFYLFNVRMDLFISYVIDSLYLSFCISDAGFSAFEVFCNLKCLRIEFRGFRGFSFQVLTQAQDSPLRLRKKKQLEIQKLRPKAVKLNTEFKVLKLPTNVIQKMSQSQKKNSLELLIMLMRKLLLRESSKLIKNNLKRLQKRKNWSPERVECSESFKVDVDLVESGTYYSFRQVIFAGVFFFFKVAAFHGSCSKNIHQDNAFMELKLIMVPHMVDK